MRLCSNCENLSDIVELCVVLQGRPMCPKQYWKDIVQGVRWTEIQGEPIREWTESDESLSNHEIWLNIAHFYVKVFHHYSTPELGLLL